MKVDLIRLTQPRSVGVGRALFSAPALWLAGVVWASRSGALSAPGIRFVPGFALLVAFGIGIPVASNSAMPAVRVAIDTIGLRRLTLILSDASHTVALHTLASQADRS